ncbi:MAG: 23S rRNA (adenine(2503)-C(2))-methyltransferase RlmN [Pseudomonadota bacterium]
MLAAAEKPNLVGLGQRPLEAFFNDLGEKPFRARQVMQWIHQRSTSDFSAMTDLSVALRARLTETAGITLPRVLTEQRSTDGTIKWLFDSGAGQAIETVFIPEADRGTLCVSSQVGCVLDCAFCATGAQGFNRNLSSAEIIGQVCHASRHLPKRENGESAITNVVFMGMGEPLANYRQLLPALDVLVSDYAYGLSRRRVTVSTAGLVPHIEKLGDDLNVSLAVSLHAPNDALRDELVPINRRHPIAELLAACWRYAANYTKRFITFEYVMLRGVNDSLVQADELIGLLKGHPAKVNLIPFNGFGGSRFQCSSAATIHAFQNRLRVAGIVTTTRKTRGDDIDAACGQLAGKVSDRVRARLSEKTGRRGSA